MSADSTQNALERVILLLDNALDQQSAEASLGLSAEVEMHRADRKTCRQMHRGKAHGKYSWKGESRFISERLAAFSFVIGIGVKES
jgi:hypothetical protein